ncbi:helix-turn-helix domain-containing protein [Prosthecochloris sp.]|uniref:helix-turn-helix domain-containing protein n=1 Tax=Prosthecochloris sp. TaxID=290513 RepID=UPI0025D661C4|nr:helix-turn-helix domain-containing protein [Prosthecochloris sp.]
MIDESAYMIIQEIRHLKDEVARLGNQVVYTTSEAAAYMRCTEDWLRRAAHAGKIEHFLVGRDMRFRKVDLDAFRVTPVGEKAMEKLRQMAAARIGL